MKLLLHGLLVFFQRHPTAWHLTPRRVQTVFGTVCKSYGLLERDPNWRRHVPCDDCLGKGKPDPRVVGLDKMPSTWACATCKRTWHWVRSAYTTEIGSWVTLPEDTRADA